MISYISDMPRFIIKIEDKYFEWSTIVDAPVTYGMTEQELRDYIKEEYGNQGLEGLPDRLKRVARQGTSCLSDCPIDDLLTHNRAGDNDSRLTKEEIYAKYSQNNAQDPNSQNNP
jgi:hypothetical protein